MSLKKLFRIFLGIQLTLGIGLAILTFSLFLNQAELSRSQDVSFQSYLLADELRQSSDDLTRLARTYVATGNEEYERQYWAVLDIRNGKSPRPVGYNRIYWDFISGTGQKPRPDGPAISLHELMVKEGFTDGELEKLTLSQKYSDELVKIEKIAMNAVKGLFDDGKGNFTVRKEPDRALAIRLMNDEAYHKHKVNIMKPIDEFYIMFAERTATDVARYEKHSMNLLRALGVLIIVIMGMFGYSFVMIQRQITKREQAEEALLASEGRYRSIVETSIEGIWITSEEHRITFVNKRMTDMLAYAPEEILGRRVASFMFEEDLEDYASRLAARQRGVGEVFERRFRRKDGTTIWNIVSASPLFDGQDRFIGSVAMFTDVTDRKRVDEENRSLQERLQRSEKMESLGTLAGGVAHDLNNVLGIVVGYAEMILDEMDQSSSLRSHLAKIMNGGQRAAAIVDDLLTLARRGVSDRDVLNLNKIIADCQQSPEFEKLSSYHPSVKIQADLGPDLPNIAGSSVHLDKSLYNLVSNACEAMTKGGMVTIKTTSQYLEQPLQGYDEVREGDYVVLSVSDTGEGIPADDLKRIFEPFYTKKVMGRSGTGLGLAVVWGTVKDHHGYINVQSEKGEGSTFTLYFPVTREDITTEGVAASISEYLGKGESILVVDDIKEQRDLAAGMLRTLNYSVASVASGEEAVAYLKEHQADLMVLDMIMDPGMDGLETYKSVLTIHPKQKAIIVSGFSESDRVRTARDLGAGAYVRKPYIKEKLGGAVRKELDRTA